MQYTIVIQFFFSLLQTTMNMPSSSSSTTRLLTRSLLLHAKYHPLGHALLSPSSETRLDHSTT